MGPSLRTACLDCTLYDPGDPLAALLAHLSGLPYLLAYSQGLVAYATRDLVAAAGLGGMVANALLSRALKRALAQDRPLAACAALGTCSKPGMPSSHAQALAFACALHLALALARPRGPRLQQALAALEQLALLAGSCAAACSRVYLGYHTLPQVAVGAVVGALFGVVWFRVTRLLARRVLPRLQRTPLGAALGLTCSWDGEGPARRKAA